MTDRPDLEEAYMKDAIATAKQMGATVKDVEAATSQEKPLAHPHDISRLNMTPNKALEATLMTYKDGHAPAKDAPYIVQGDDAAIEEHIAQGVKRGTITDATKPAVGDGKFTSRADIAGPKGAGREIG